MNLCVIHHSFVDKAIMIFDAPIAKHQHMEPQFDVSPKRYPSSVPIVPSAK